MKKIILVVFLVLSFQVSSVFANTGNLQEEINSYKSSLFDDLKQEKNKLVDNYYSSISTFTGSENYKILKNLGKIELDSTKNDILNKYFSLKQVISKDFNDYSSQYSILNEKFEEGIISQDKFEDEKSNIKAEINSIKTKYEDLISNFVNKNSNNISSLTGSFDNKVSDNSNILDNIKQEKEKLSNLISKYNEFENLVEKINNLYRVNTDNLYDFLYEVNDITVNLLEEKLNKKQRSYYNKYVNLDYYSGDINNFQKSLISEYKDNLKNYYGELIEGFYTEDNYTYIKENYNSIKENFYNDGKINYEVLENEDLGNGYSKLIEKLKNFNSQISGNLAKVGNPEDLNSLKTNLKDKLKEFYNKESKNYVEDMTSFLEKQTELLSYKTSEELNKFNKIKDDKKEIVNFTGMNSKKLNKINNFLNKVESLNRNIISDDLSSKLSKIKYELVVKKIDLKIQIENLIRYGKDYENIDDTLQNILSNLYKGYKEKNNGKEFEGKLKGALLKIDNHLEDDKISQKSKYLILKIKKAIINFLYLENK